MFESSAFETPASGDEPRHAPPSHAWYRDEPARQRPDGAALRALQDRVWGAFERQERDPPPAARLANAIAVEAARADTSAARLARLANGDPVVAARVLSVANSSYYGFRHPAESVLEAVARIGALEVQRIAYALALESALGAAGRFDEIARRAWRHALAVSIAAGRLALLGESLAARRAPLAGLLHDLGVPALLAAADAVAHDDAGTYAWFDLVVWPLHASAGAVVAERWHLDDELRALIRLHHHPEETSDYLRPTARLLAAADRLARAAVDPVGPVGPTEDAAVALEAAVTAVAAELGRDPGDVRAIAAGLAEKVEAFAGGW